MLFSDLVACSESIEIIWERLAGSQVMQEHCKSLAVAKRVMAQCEFGLRFSATAEDVSWAGHIREFVQSSLASPLLNTIGVAGRRCDVVRCACCMLYSRLAMWMLRA